MRGSVIRVCREQGFSFRGGWRSFRSGLHSGAGPRLVHQVAKGALGRLVTVQGVADRAEQGSGLQQTPRVGSGLDGGHRHAALEQQEKQDRAERHRGPPADLIEACHAQLACITQAAWHAPAHAVAAAAAAAAAAGSEHLAVHVQDVNATVEQLQLIRIPRANP